MKMGAIVDHNMSYDPQVDILTIRLTLEPIEQSEQITPSIIVDYNAAGEIIGIEILDISAFICTTS
jgi:uncharacterized protein YuzE